MNAMNLNALTEMTEEQRQAVIDWLGPKYDELIGARNTTDLEVGLDLILESIGREGHFAT